MQLSEIIIKPILTEKSNILSEKLNRYLFRVHRKANRLEIKKAIETLYNVKVVDVNTLIIPAKSKSRFTKRGLFKGRKQAYKKAIVKLKEGDSIDSYTE